jgi:hypothetical protein
MSQLQLKNSTTNILSDKVKRGYNKINKQIDNTILISKDEFLNRIEGVDLKKYRGRTKHRTLIKDDIVLYKALVHYTDQLRGLLKKNESQKMYWVERLILCENKLNVGKHMICSCQSNSTFDPMTQDFTKKNCKKCWLPPCSKRYYKKKYGENWEEKYNEYHTKEDYLKHRKKIGRKSWFIRKGRKFNGCLCKGKNEEDILNFVENKYDIKISRGVPFIGYYVDGYCENTNTIYEVYEKYHKYQEDYDDRRRIELMDHLNCDFVVIYDNNDENLEEITIKRYAKE